MEAKKIRMVDFYMQGKTDAEIGQEIGVSRETVNTWRNNDPEVIAEINKQIQAIGDRMRARLVKLTGKAFDLVDKKLDDGDIQTALSVLRLLERTGILEKMFEVGEKNPASIKHNQVFEKILNGD